MNKRADSLPPFAFALVAVALATGALLLPRLSGTFQARFSTIHVRAVDAAFSAALAVCWIYVASWVHIDGARTNWHVPRMLQGYGSLAALLALYMTRFHPNVSALRTTTVFLLGMLLCESLWAFVRSLSQTSSRRALVVGTGRVASTVWRDLRTGRLPEMSFAGFTSESFREDFCPDIAARYVGDVAELKSIVFRESVDDLIIASRAEDGSLETEEAIEVAANLGLRVWTVRQALGVPGFATNSVSEEYIELVPDPVQSAIRCAVKRSLDVILSASALIIGFPIAVATIARERVRGREIRVEWESRVGFHRRRFYIRRIVWAPGTARLRDWTNKYLQMWNVLRGDMSMVGPCALSPEQLSRSDVPESAARFGIRPGLTGGWAYEPQADSSAAAIGSRHQIHHAERWSLASDLIVLTKSMSAFVQRNLGTHAGTGAL